MSVRSELQTRGATLLLREAVADDVPAVVRLITEDQLGADRDGLDDADQQGALQPHLDAFAAVDADPAHLLLVAVADDAVVATMQLSFLPGLARRGALRAQVEAVRVAASHRSGGLGTAMLTWAVAESRRRGCALVQLTTDASRVDAHHFYDRLGSTASHVGYELRL